MRGPEGPLQAAEGWEGGEDEKTDCSFRGFAVVEKERNTAEVREVKWFFFLLFFLYSTGSNMFIGQGKYTVETGKLNIQERRDDPQSKLLRKGRGWEDLGRQRVA